jgi:hypothetical protein
MLTETLDQPDFPQKDRKKVKIPLDSASYKLYYVNYEICTKRHTPRSVFPSVSLFSLPQPSLFRAVPITQRQP